MNIVNPPNGPDPTGMAAALSALAAPNPTPSFSLTPGATESGGSVDGATAGGLMTRLFAKRPGVCGVWATAFWDGKKYENGTTVSVLFVHVTGNAFGLEFASTGWFVERHIEEIMRLSRSYAAATFEGINIRFVWNPEIPRRTPIAR